MSLSSLFMHYSVTLGYGVLGIGSWLAVNITLNFLSLDHRVESRKMINKISM